MTPTSPAPSNGYAVVIPTRGRRQMVLQALESVFAQTLPPGEVIVVVDGDTDGTVPAIRRAHPTVRVIEHASSLGAATSRNDGMAAATAEWICLLDDDDIWHSRKQEAFFDYVALHPECAALRSAFWQFSEPGTPGDLSGFKADLSAPADRVTLERLTAGTTTVNDFTYLDIEGRSLSALLEKNCGVTSSTMFRRDLLPGMEKIPHGLATAQDWLLFVYIAAQTEWHLVPGAWFFYRVHGNQVTSRLGPSRWRHRITAWDLAWQHAGFPHAFRLEDYAHEYAGDVHRFVWDELSHGRLRSARQAYRAGSSFVRSPALRLSILMPPPLRWRMRRLLRRL